MWKLWPHPSPFFKFLARPLFAAESDFSLKKKILRRDRQKLLKMQQEYPRSGAQNRRFLIN